MATPDVELRFDRGTILLVGSPNGVNLADAPGVLWDRRVRTYRAPAARHSILKRWLRANGVWFQDISPRPRSIREAWSAVDLRAYQEAGPCRPGSWLSDEVSSRFRRGAARPGWPWLSCNGRN